MRPEKESMVAEFRERLEGAGYVVLADCSGMNVEQMAGLRSELRDAEARLQVVKNRLLAHAGAAAGLEALAPLLQGPTAMITGSGDVTQVARVLRGFARRHERPALKGGCIGAEPMTGEDVAALAAIPSREVLLAQVLGTLAAPLRQLAGVFQQKLASVVYVLKAVEEKRAASG